MGYLYSSFTEYDSSLRHLGVVRVNKGSHSFTIFTFYHAHTQLEWAMPALTAIEHHCTLACTHLPSHWG